MKRAKVVCSLAICTTLLVLIPATTHASLVQTQCESVSVASVAPPSGFSPLTASDAELRCYGFPRRPTDLEALKAWTDAMSKAKYWVQPHLVARPGVNYGIVRTSIGNWAGYDAKSSDNGGTQWDEVQAHWHAQPERNADGHAIGSWVGLGGIGAPLEQAGTDLRDDGHSTTYFFTQYKTANGSCCSINDVTSIPIRTGQQMYVDVSLLGNYAVAFLEDQDTGQYTNVQFATNQAQGKTSTEWIQEDSSGGYNSYYGTEFLYPTTWATTSNNGTAASSLNVEDDKMGYTTTGQVFLYPSAFQTDCCGRFYLISTH